MTVDLQAMLIASLQQEIAALQADVDRLVARVEQADLERDAAEAALGRLRVAVERLLAETDEDYPQCEQA